ncbi:lysM domain receptor-like kinase 4 [Dorcoceras hygrometricum]|uniref:LysM domain receptor-like kinase 4 n=1 Tax=Dorcoceras hygrometricum TaxID=472368 RepID=A0A2Z7CKS8_9LAMI|nr:lysM domain receptor-like kinase 4 [Dorcoceras hygrometricum]
MATDKMQVLCMRTRLQRTQGAKGSQGLLNSNKGSTEQQYFSGHRVCEYMRATHSSQHMVPDAQHDSTRCCPTHEMWELPTPLIVDNRSQQGDEVRELPARLNSILGPSNTDPPPAKPKTSNYSRTEAEKSNSWELRTRPALFYPSNSTESSKQHKVESEHLPQQARTESDAYANRLQKGDVFAHLTSFKQTSESNIQTKRLSNRSPTLPLLFQSELSTVGNRRR